MRDYPLREEEPGYTPPDWAKFMRLVIDLTPAELKWWYELKRNDGEED